MQKIQKLGLINIHAYEENTIDIVGNSLLVKAGNGSGKTIFMTSLYPALFTLDLESSLNLGGSKLRKLSETLNQDTSFIYGQFSMKDEIFSLVTAYVLTAQGVKRKAYHLNTPLETITFTDQNATPLSFSDFEKINKNFIIEKFTTQRKYQSYLANHIYGVDIETFKRRIAISYKIASPAIVSADSSNAKYNLESILADVRDVLPSMKDNAHFNEVLDAYVNQAIAAHEEQKEVTKLYKKLAYLANIRQEVALSNKDTLKQAHKLIGDKELKKENLIEQGNQLVEEKNKLYEQIKTEETLQLELLDNINLLEGDKRDVDYRLNDLMNQEKMAKQNLALLNEQLKAKELEKYNLAKAIAKNENQLELNQERINTLKETLKKPITLPFGLKEWPLIQKTYKESQTNQKKLTKLDTEIDMLENNLKITSQDLEAISKTKTDLSNQVLSSTGLKENQLSNIISNLQKEIIDCDFKLKELQIKEKILKAQYQELHDNPEPPVSFEANKALPLFQVIDFKEDVDTNQQVWIENHLRSAGLLELLITADQLKEGTIYDQTQPLPNIQSGAS